MAGNLPDEPGVWQLTEAIGITPNGTLVCADRGGAPIDLLPRGNWLPAAKAGQSIEEAAADRIRELEAENARLKSTFEQRVRDEVRTGMEMAAVDEQQEREDWRLGTQAIWDRVQELSPWCESNDMPWCDEILCGLVGVKQRVADLTAERDKLQRFKDWVHTYLDAKNIPTHPDGPHSKEGCRIGDRMDFVFAERDALAERERGLRNILDSGKGQSGASILFELLDNARVQLEAIVCVVPPDDGVVLLSNDGPCHYDAERKCQVYDHEHFSPLGDALMALHGTLAALSPAPSPAQEDATSGDYPNIEACRDGRTSGRLNEWPVLRQECGQVLAELATLRERLAVVEGRETGGAFYVTTSEFSSLCKAIGIAEPAAPSLVFERAPKVIATARAEAEAAKGATLFASEAHKGQTRKYNGRPYIEHPMRVAHAALLQDAPPHVVAAAWLHDVIEDCGTTSDCLSAKFGYDVAALVVELTNPSKGSKLPRAHRKAMDREHIAKASYWAKVLKLLDRIDNISEMRGCGDDFLNLYAKESRLLADAIEATDERLLALKDVLELAIADSLATPSTERPAT